MSDTQTSNIPTWVWFLIILVMIGLTSAIRVGCDIDTR